MIKLLYDSILLLKAKQIKGWQLLYKICKLLLNICYPIVASMKRECGISNEGKVIVSLTSFPDRIGDVWISISSIMDQTQKAKRIILWLAREQFPEDKPLPKSLSRLQRRGLEIRYCENLMPHKKYYGSMVEYPDEVIVTIDDDIFYPKDHLEKLWKAHERYPDAVCCWYGHVVTYREDGSIQNYNEWTSDVNDYMVPSLQLVPVGCGGVLYPPEKLAKQVFNKEDIYKLCLKTDDLWLKAMEVLADVKAVRCEKYSMIFFGLIKTRHKGLFAENADRDGNDVALEAILHKYPLVAEKLYNDFIEGEA